MTSSALSRPLRALAVGRIALGTVALTGTYAAIGAGRLANDLR